MKNKKILQLILILGLLPFLLSANKVVHAPGSVASLEAGWDWAHKSAAGSKGFYVGYMIQRLMNENSHIGSWSSDSEYKTTLYEIITGKKVKKDVDEKSVAELAKEILEQKKGKKGAGEKVLKDVAFLFRFSGDHRGKYDCQTIKMSNLEAYVELEQGTIYWLGRVEQKESLNFLDKFFNKSGSDEVRKKIVSAVGIHGAGPDAYSFLKKVITGNYPDKIRKNAVFWIGEHETAQCVNFLLDRARRDNSTDVKEQAVFSLYRIDLEAADDGLIALARKDKDPGVRKKAIFWLGQKACDMSAEVLGGIVKDDPNTDIQKQAVFALSQLSKGSGIPELIKIAKTHKNMKVRKQAIFWLGQSGDPRGLDTIVEILKSRKK